MECVSISSNDNVMLQLGVLLLLLSYIELLHDSVKQSNHDGTLKIYICNSY